MDEKVLFDWKENNAEVYSKFKQELEDQLQKPYHQNILDLGDGNAGPLLSVIANLYAVSSEEGFDVDKLYKKAVLSGDASASTCFAIKSRMIENEITRMSNLFRRDMQCVRFSQMIFGKV